MAVMLGNLYGALREAGVSEDKAVRAAEELASFNDISGIKGDISDLKKDVSGLKMGVSALTADVAVLKWMVGFVLALVIGGFSVLIRLGIR